MKTPADMAAVARITGCRPFYNPSAGRIEFHAHSQPGYWPIGVTVRESNIETTPAGTVRRVCPVTRSA